MTYRFRKRRVRESLKVNIEISSYRVGFGRDYMGVDVTVTENGHELLTFSERETTGRSSFMKRLSKGLAKRIYQHIKTL